MPEEDHTDESFPIIARLQKQRPRDNFLYTAIRTLTDPKEMQAFGEELTAWCGDHFPEAQDDPSGAAGRSLGYALGGFDREIRDRWQEVFPQIVTGPAARFPLATTPEGLGDAIRDLLRNSR